MRTAVRLAGFAAGLALVFAMAWLVGASTGPAPTGAGGVAAPVDPHLDAVTGAHQTGAHQTGAHRTGAHQTGAHQTGAHQPAAGADGLAATAAGYTLVPHLDTFMAGVPGELTFAVTGADGRPVTAFDVEHERQLHLIVLRRDTSGFQHLHPVLGPDGLWRVPLTLPAGGVYRAFADFAPAGGPAMVLGTDLYAIGDFVPIGFPPNRVAQVDGYQVRLDGDLVAGGPSQVFATVTRNGVPVTDLEPYLGAFGHLVALRQGDLAYLHVHPDAAQPAPTDRAGPAIAFTADVPTSGEYRLFLDFQHGGAVRTAEFTVQTRDT